MNSPWLQLRSEWRWAGSVNIKIQYIQVKNYRRHIDLGMQVHLVSFYYDLIYF